MTQIAIKGYDIKFAEEEIDGLCTTVEKEIEKELVFEFPLHVKDGVYVRIESSENGYEELFISLKDLMPLFRGLQNKLLSDSFR